MHPSIKRISFTVSALLVLGILGVVGFRWIEGYTWIDSIYMTIITMSTVGYGTVGEMSAGGKLFAILLIILSAGTFVYAVTTITAFFVEGEIGLLMDRYRINKKVTKLKDHIIICGLGRNGREAAIELIRQQKLFLVIEVDSKVVDDFMEAQHAKILVIIGDATHEDVLEKANIHQARGLISSLSKDSENVYIALTAREMNPKLNIVARASSETTISKLKRAGANKVILPNMIGGKRMVNLLTRPALMEFIDMVTGEGNPDLHLEEVFCGNNPQLVGASLIELRIRSRTGVVVIGWKQGSAPVELNPHAEKKLTEKDRLFVLGTEKQLQTFSNLYLN